MIKKRTENFNASNEKTPPQSSSNHGGGDNARAASQSKNILDSLLVRDAAAYPIAAGISPWFAARTAALAREIPQNARGCRMFAQFPNLRWLLPLPLAGALAPLLLLIHISPLSRSGTSSSSDSEFEEHLEMFTSSDSNQPDYFTETEPAQ